MSHFDENNEGTKSPFERPEQAGPPSGQPERNRPLFGSSESKEPPVEHTESARPLFGTGEHKEQPYERSEHAAQPVEQREYTGSTFASQGGARVPPVGPPVHTRSHSSAWLPLLLGALLCLVIGGLVGWGITEASMPQQNSGVVGYKSGSMAPEQVIAQGRQAVVQINVQTGQGAGIGSGVIIDQQGHIVTNDHVVSGGQKFSAVLFDGTVMPAQLVGADTADDLAVIKINPSKKMYAMPIGDSSKLQVGQPVLAIGNPLGITQTVTSGIVSALGRTVNEGQGGGVIVDAVQTDAAINPGNSGGALVDLNGNLVGIPTLVAIDPEFKTPANGVGFAVPSNRAKFITPQIIKYGKVEHSGRAAIGASVTTVDSLVAAQAGLSVNQGVLVVSVTPNGPSAQAGLQPGDVITKLNNTQINNASDLSDALLSYDPGTTVTVGIVRGTQQMQVRMKLSELQIS